MMFDKLAAGRPKRSDELQRLINGYYDAAVAHNRFEGGLGTTEELHAAGDKLVAYIERLTKWLS